MLPKIKHAGMCRRLPIHRYGILSIGTQLQSPWENGPRRVCLDHRQHFECFECLLPKAGIHQLESLWIDHRWRHSSIGLGPLCLGAFECLRIGQSATHHRCLFGPLGVVSQLTTHWTLWLSAHHSCRNPQIAQSLTQHQSTCLLCTSDPTPFTRWHSTTLLPLLRRSLVVT